MRNERKEKEKKKKRKSGLLSRFFCLPPLMLADADKEDFLWFFSTSDSCFIYYQDRSNARYYVTSAHTLFVRGMRTTCLKFSDLRQGNHSRPPALRGWVGAATV